MDNNFDTVLDRRHTNSVKWDLADELTGVPDVLPMWVADMDFPAPEPVLDALRRRIDHGILGYSMIPESCYEAVMAWAQQRHNWTLEKEWIVFTSGVVPAIHHLVMAWTQPGDRVVVQPPVYYPFFKAARVNQCEMVENPLRLAEGRYLMDFDQLEQVLDDRAKVLVLCSPHNPVGRLWTPQELTRLGELCLKHDVLVCSDEIHWDLALYDHRHTPTASVSEAIAQNTITLIAPNKTFNLAGVSIAMAIIPNPRLRERFVRMQAELGIHVHGNLLGAIAAEAAYRHGAAWLDELRLYIQGNLEFLQEYLAQQLPQLRLVPPEGTYLAWLDCRALGLDDAELKRFMLCDGKVWCNDGPTFGPGGSGFQRLNLACPRSILRQALERLERAVKLL